MLRVATLQIKLPKGWWKLGENLLNSPMSLKMRAKKLFTLLKSTKKTCFVVCLVKIMHFDF